ncbi:MAG: MarR family winged helix-turn-helix transcriptional regulator, partial [Gemmatimonadota bacterium]
GSERGRLLGRLSGELRRMGIATVMFHQVMAEKLGLNATDSRAFSILQETGPIPAGRLAELTGLSTGAVTTIIDRLEAAGYARRESDPADRRRVIVAPVEDPERDRRILAIVGTMREPMAEWMAEYTDEEIELILDFLDSGVEFLRDQTVRLRNLDDGGS